MKAAVYTKYGPPEVLEIKDITKPVPNEKEVLVKIHTVAATIADSRVRAANFPAGLGFMAKLVFGITAPRKQVLGSSFSGVVESVGSEVTKYKQGDEVFGMTGTKFSAYAEYLTISEGSSVAHKPSEISHEDASALSFGGTTALYFLRDVAKIKSGQTILINGASGAVGTNAVQLAKYFGAKVTAICSTKNIDLVKSLGADKVIDYTKENYLDTEDNYDFVMDAVGNMKTDEATSKLNPQGKFLLVVGDLKGMLKAAFSKNILQGTSPEKKEDLEFLADLMKDGKLKAIIDSTFTLDQIVEAHHKIDSGHKVGNIVIKV